MPRSDGSPPCTQHASTLAVALYTGAVVRYVHASASRQAAHPLPATHFGQPQSSGDDENGSSASRFPSPEPASSSHARPLAASPAGQRTPLQPPALRLGSPQQHRRRQQQQQRQSDDVSSPSLPASPRRMPWQRHGQLQRASQQAAQEERWPTSPCSSTQGDELEVQTAFVPCVHAYSSVRGSSSHSLQKHQQLLSCTSGGGKAMAAVRLAAVPSHLDLEACIYDALRQQGLPPAALEDYAAAPVQGGEWQGYDGLLLLAVLRLARAAAPLSGQKRAQPPPVAAVPAAAVQQEQARRQAAPHRSACVLLHAAAVDGAARLLEWLEPPYPWHDDLSAFLVQQTAVAGGARCRRLAGERREARSTTKGPAHQLSPPAAPTWLPCRPGLRKGGGLLCRLPGQALRQCAATTEPPAIGAHEPDGAGQRDQPAAHSAPLAAAGHSGLGRGQTVNQCRSSILWGSAVETAGKAGKSDGRRCSRSWTPCAHVIPARCESSCQGTESSDARRCP